MTVSSLTRFVAVVTSGSSQSRCGFVCVTLSLWGIHSWLPGGSSPGAAAGRSGQRLSPNHTHLREQRERAWNGAQPPGPQRQALTPPPRQGVLPKLEARLERGSRGAGAGRVPWVRRVCPHS